MADEFVRHDPPPYVPPDREPKTASEKMFAEQRKRQGKDFLGGWFPRGEDGKSEDPRFGESTPEAPYGYMEGTNTPRKEPIYDQFGRPIIPRPKKDCLEADVVGFGPLWCLKGRRTLVSHDWAVLSATLAGEGG